MPKSRNRRTRDKRPIKLPVFKVRDTKVGPVNEHMGFRVVGREPVSPNMGRLKTDLEKEAYRAWKNSCKNAKAVGAWINKNDYITEYIANVKDYQQKEAV